LSATRPHHATAPARQRVRFPVSVRRSTDDEGNLRRHVFDANVRE
jgi:hypothetical protein